MSEKFKSSGIVVLLTDFGVDDDYVGLMHASVLRFSPGVRIIDLCHSIPPGNVRSAAFILKNDYRYFPKVSVFVCVVDPGVGSDREIIIADIDGYLFIAPDNGILSPLLKEIESPVVYNLNTKIKLLDNISNTFHGRDIFAPVAGMLSIGEDIYSFAEISETAWQEIDIQPKMCVDEILGEVIWIDRYGNLITNIEGNLITDHKLIINNRVIRKVKIFNDGNTGEIVWLFGSKSTVEIVMNGANCQNELKYDIGSKIIFVK
jgi:S-adenosyl-L-methionine hydrolase (adenosine-forming)